MHNEEANLDACCLFAAKRSISQRSAPLIALLVRVSPMLSLHAACVCPSCCWRRFIAGLQDPYKLVQYKDVLKTVQEEHRILQDMEAALEEIKSGPSTSGRPAAMVRAELLCSDDTEEPTAELVCLLAENCVHAFVGRTVLDPMFTHCSQLVCVVVGYAWVHLGNSP